MTSLTQLFFASICWVYSESLDSGDGRDKETIVICNNSFQDVIDRDTYIGLVLFVSSVVNTIFELILK